MTHQHDRVPGLVTEPPASRANSHRAPGPKPRFRRAERQSPTLSQLAVAQTQQMTTYLPTRQSVKTSSLINPTTSTSTTAPVATDIGEEEIPDEDEAQAEEQVKSLEQSPLTYHLVLQGNQRRHQFHRHQQFKPRASPRARSSPHNRLQ